MNNLLDSKFWDNISRRTSVHYRNKYVADYHKYENEELFNEWCSQVRHKRILITDVFNEAFDREELSGIFRAPDADIIGMDISSFIVNKFHTAYPLKKKLVCDIRSLPFKDDKFDIIISPSTLDHFPQSDLEMSLGEIRRVLKKEGILILSVHNKFNVFLHFYIIKMTQKYPFPMTVYSKNQLIKILNKNKFHISECTATMHILFPALFPFILFYIDKFGTHKFRNLLFKKIFNYFTKLRRKRTKYLTGKFITVKAMKI